MSCGGNDEIFFTVLADTETCLVSGVASSYVGVPGHVVARGDTDGNIRKPGARLYVADRVKFLEVDNDFSYACAVNLPDLDSQVVSAYRPPCNTAAYDDVLLECVVAC